MPEIIPDHVSSPRTLLAWDGTAYRPVRIHTDGTLQVRGEDQLFSFKGVLANYKSVTISGANGYGYSNPPPAGEIWCVTDIASESHYTATTEHQYRLFHDGAEYHIGKVVAAIAVAEWRYWKGFKWLEPGDQIRVYFIGAPAGEIVRVTVTGYIMTLEV